MNLTQRLSVVELQGPAVALSIFAIAVAIYTYISGPSTVFAPVTLMTLVAIVQVARPKPTVAKRLPILITYAGLTTLVISWVWLRRSVGEADSLPLATFWPVMAMTIAILLYTSYRSLETFWYGHPKVWAWRNSSRRNFRRALVLHAIMSCIHIVITATIIAYRASPYIAADSTGYVVLGAALVSVVCGIALALEKLRPSRMAQGPSY